MSAEVGTEVSAEPAEPGVLPVARTAIVVRPGDRVLLVVSERLTRAQLDDAEGFLGERFPEAEITVVCGVDEVVHVPAEATSESGEPA